MKKLGLALISCIALVAFMGFSAPAFAAMTIDPACDLDNPAAGDGIPGPYNNDAVVHKFKIDTPDSHVEHAVSAVEGSGLACGSEWTGLFTSSNYYDNVDVTNPRGVVVNDTSTMPNTGFVGTAKINIMSTLLGGIVPNQLGTIRIAPIAECEAETPVGDPIPGDIVSCQKTSFSVGYNYNWTNEDTSTSPPTYRLTIGPAHTAGKAGPTHIKAFNLCGRVGAAGTGQGVYPDDCGDSSQPYLQSNGDATYGSLGVYRATATQRGTTPAGGLTTPVATTCVVWSAVTPPAGNPYPWCKHTQTPVLPKDKVSLP